jgi:hypothetical protein
MLDWDLDSYQNWLVATFTMIANGSPSQTPPSPGSSGGGVN